MGARPTPALEALRIPDYRRFWLGSGLASFALNFWFLGAAWLIFDLTSSPLLVGLVNGLAAGPSILLSVVGGALTDRIDRRRLLVAARLVWAGLALALGVLVVLDSIEAWHILAGAVVFGLADAASSPAGHTLLVDLVGKGRLIATNALDQISEFGGELVAPLGAGLLIARWGSAPGFLLAAVLLALAALSMARIQLRGGSAAALEAPRGLLADIGEGLGYTLRTRPFPLLLGLSALSLLSAAVFPLIPVYARDVLEVGPAGFGALSAALAGGMLVGALWMAAIGEVRHPGPVVVVARVAWFLAMAGFALSGSFLASLALLVAMGIAGAISSNLLLTQFQAHADDRMRGRVMSVHRIADSLEPVGAVLGGALAVTIGAKPTLLLCAALGIAALVGLVSLAPRSVALRTS